jgi:hypothetical protein
MHPARHKSARHHKLPVRPLMDFSRRGLFMSNRSAVAGGQLTRTIHPVYVSSTLATHADEAKRATAPPPPSHLCMQQHAVHAEARRYHGLSAGRRRPQLSTLQWLPAWPLRGLGKPPSPTMASPPSEGSGRRERSRWEALGVRGRLFTHYASEWPCGVRATQRRSCLAAAGSGCSRFVSPSCAACVEAPTPLPPRTPAAAPCKPRTAFLRTEVTTRLVAGLAFACRPCCPVSRARACGIAVAWVGEMLSGLCSSVWSLPRAAPPMLRIPRVHRAQRRARTQRCQAVSHKGRCLHAGKGDECVRYNGPRVSSSPPPPPEKGRWLRARCGTMPPASHWWRVGGLSAS